MFRLRARDDREFREAQRAGQALLALHTEWPLLDPPRPTAAPEAAAHPDFLTPDFRAPSRQDVEGFMMRWERPLVIGGDVHACPTCAEYRDWIVLCMRDDSVWLRCRAGHQVREPRLDAAWYNRNSGPADRFHPTLEDGLRYLGH
ncbi:hypothetical protein [Streptomyces sp. NPDC047315]|uniref:hypothetical protein n=1 Tax=Streptomyces sp. NPDC047315 TaxID=3155142 RepID=UPI0033D3A59C